MRIKEKMGFFRKNTDLDWEKIGETDPYFGVLTNDIFKKTVLTEEAKNVFFLSGELYVREVMKIIKEKIDENFNPREAIDFGCGVGRIAIPLSKYCEIVYCVDVSSGMLQESLKNCDSSDVTNVEFVLSNGKSVGVNHAVDLIHSFIVFQHIPVDRGMKIFVDLLNHLRDGGVGVVHFTYYQRASAAKQFLQKFVGQSRFMSTLWNIAKRRPLSYPIFEMNIYNLNKIMKCLHDFGCHNIHVSFSEHGNNYLGILLFFQKSYGLVNGL